MSKSGSKSGSKERTIRRMSEVLSHIKLRSKALGCILDYYDNLDRRGELWKSDDLLAYTIAKAQMNELERLVQYIESVE